MHNEQDLKSTPEYRSGMFRIVTCPRLRPSHAGYVLDL